METNWLWQISDTTHLSGMVNYNIHDSALSQTGTALSVERTPRLRYYLGHYFLKNGDAFRDDDGHYISGGFGYRLTEKYTMAFTQQYDLSQTASNYSRATFIREFPHWFGAFSIGLRRDTRQYVIYGQCLAGKFWRPDPGVNANYPDWNPDSSDSRDWDEGTG